MRYDFAMHDAGIESVKSLKLYFSMFRAMKKQVLYRQLAGYYDLIYSFKDYRKEVARLKKLIFKYKKSDGNELLDVACGTGHHLRLLKDDYSCMGVDVNKEMLAVARRNVDGVRFQKSDMRDLDLGKKFDVVTCLFSSIGYVRTYANLKRSISSMAKHLKKGGVLLIEPWLARATYHVGSPHITIYDGETVKIARANVSQVRGNVSVMDMHYLIAEKDGDVKHFVDRHEMGLFDVDRTLEMMRKAGLRAKFLKNGLMKERGLFVGVKE